MSHPLMDDQSVTTPQPCNACCHSRHTLGNRTSQANITLTIHHLHEPRLAAITTAALLQEHAVPSLPLSTSHIHIGQKMIELQSGIAVMRE